MDIKLEFTKPAFVSSSIDKEVINISFKSENWFKDEDY